MKAVLMITEAGCLLRTSEHDVQALVREHAIPFRKLGRRLVFLEDELDEWLRGLPGVSVEQALARHAQPPQETDVSPRGPVVSEPAVGVQAPEVRLVRGARRSKLLLPEMNANANRERSRA